MRNMIIHEVENGWKCYPNGQDRCTIPPEYVFNDWSEMIEFIEDYFADEEE